MTELEELIRATLADRADDAPTPDGLTASVRMRRQKSRRTRQAIAVVAVAAATAAAVVIPLTVSASPHTDHNQATTPPPAPKPSTEQVIGYHGIELTVPASWQINAATCGRPHADTVIRDEGVVPACFGGSAQPGRRISSVELTADLIGTAKSIRQTSAYTNPHGVLFSRGVAGGRIGAIAPAAGVVLFIDSTPALTQRILDSVRPVKVDSTGCKMREFQLRPPFSESAIRGPYQPDVIESGPASIAICHYEDNWLVSSTVTTGAAMANIVQQANAAPKGFVHEAPHRGAYVPCATPVRLGGAKGTGYILLVHYPNGFWQQLWFHMDCGSLGITNGQRAGALTTGLAKAINDPLHRGFAIPGDLLPGPG